jgi:hypothetical protein
MNSGELGNFGRFTVGLVLLILLAFGILQWLHIPSGHFVDWVIGAASLWWLLVIVTVPWNIHFGARTVLMEAEQSRQAQIPVDERQLGYVRQVARRALWVAIALHLISAVGLYGLAATGISNIGYISAGATLLLTILRPAAALYDYLAQRLREIGHQNKYPRQDVVELRGRIEILEAALERIEHELNPEHPDGWAARQQRMLDSLRYDLTQVGSSFEDLKVTNQAEHERLTRDARNAIAQLSTDGQFLDHVREIIRFFKTA